MNKINLSTLVLLSSLLCTILTACGNMKEFSVPPLTDPPVLAGAAFKDMADQVPTYGISMREGRQVQFEVNIEAEDSPKVRAGERAVAYPIPKKIPIPCRVSRVMRSVSSETGQSIAWLDPIQVSSTVPRGEFIYAAIHTGLHPHALSVPREAILVNNGQTMVIRRQMGTDGKASYVPQPVEVGIVSDIDVEIKSGINSNDQVVIQSGLGFLNPNFKANAEGD
jgi:multidrug efflux pump subunit AcrA (membrane-fusion protein)